MIEQLIQELTEALNENTAAIKQHIAALGAAPATVAAPAPAKKAPTKKLEVVADPEPEPEPEEAEETVEEETPEPEPDLTPTKVAVKTKSNDTPNVPSKGHTPDGQPTAGEHVDVDEVIAQINATVKGKLLKAADPEPLKVKWAGIRKAYGVDRIADLRGNPAALLKALAQAKAL